MPRRPHHASPPAFTLMEVLISMAIVVILILGVNAVFRMASDTVGTGEALAVAQRNNRNIQSILFSDVQNVVTYNYPFFIIRSEATAAFRNAADEQSDKDYNRSDALNKTLGTIRSIDLNNDGKEDGPGELTPITALSRRNHRIDQVAFFSRGNYARQTGNNGSYSSSVSSNEAMVWYGHTRQPADYDENDTLTSSKNKARKPGPEATATNEAPETASTSPNNFYAGNWILGRAVVLLREPFRPTEGEGQGQLSIRDQDGRQQYYIGRLTNEKATSLAPLSARQNQISSRSTKDSETAASDRKGGAAYTLDWLRYDVAGTSIDGYRRILHNWFVDPSVTPLQRQQWYENFTTRFVAYPYVTRPLTSEMASRTVSAFLPGCTQFAVEFAGDYVTQDNNPNSNNYGEVQFTKPDGVVDFYVVKPINNIATWRREIRWYGFPRDTNGDGRIPGNQKSNNDMPDVVPLRDVLHTSIAGEYGSNDFSPVESQEINNANLGLPRNITDYAAPNAVKNGAKYVVGWSTETSSVPLPKMLRFTISIDDSTGRLPEGQTYEYVMELPH